MTLIALSTAWLIGIAAVPYINPPLALLGLLVILPLAALILWRDDATIRRIASCGLFLLLGSVRYTVSLPNLTDPGHIAAYRDQGEVTLWGRAVGEPDVRDTYTNLRLAVDRVQIGGGDRQNSAAELHRPRTQARSRLSMMKVLISCFNSLWGNTPISWPLSATGMTKRLLPPRRVAEALA